MRFTKSNDGFFWFVDNRQIKNEIVLGIVRTWDQIIGIHEESGVRLFQLRMFDFYIFQFGFRWVLMQREVSQEDVLQIAQRRQQRQNQKRG